MLKITYINYFKKYDEMNLSPIGMFYNMLNGKNCNIEDYLYAKLV